MDRHASPERMAHDDRRRLQLPEHRRDRGRVVVRSPDLGRRRGRPEAGQVQGDCAHCSRRLPSEHGAPVLVAARPPVERKHPRAAVGSERRAEEAASVEGLQHGQARTAEGAG